MLRILKSGSAGERLRASGEFLRSFQPSSELLVVGASRDSVDDLVREFAGSLPATFGLHRFSLTQLAATLALPLLAADDLAPASTLGTQAIATRAVFEVLSRGKLEYVGPVARHPGFAHACSRTIAELRLSGSLSQDMTRLSASAPDIASLMLEFEKQLAAASVADRALIFSTAAEVVREGSQLAKLPILFLDVHIHSRIEEELLLALAASAPEALFVVPAGDLRTLGALANFSGAVQLESEAYSPTSSLSRLQRYLFSEETPGEGKADNQVILFSAPGEERECVEIARKILDEGRQRARFDQIAVLVRGPENYVRLLETAFRRAGIAAYFARGNRRPDPSGRAFLALLACAAEGLSANRFAEYLSFSEVPDLGETVDPEAPERFQLVPEDEALGMVAAFPRPEEQETQPLVQVDDETKAQLAGSLRAPWKWEELLVEAAVIGGEERWSRRLNGLEHQLKVTLEVCRRDDPDSARAENLRREVDNLIHLRNFAMPVIHQLAALPTSATWGEWLAALRQLVPAVLRRPQRVLTLLADLNPMVPVGPVSLEEVRTVLHQRLATIEQEPPPHRYGRVFVGSPDQARGRGFEVVFVPGLTEKVFPQKLREDPLLLDDIRRELSPDLARLTDQSQHERLLLQIAVGAAKHRLYLSYPRLEVGEGRPRVPSFYALDVYRSITARVPNFEELAQDAEKVVDSRLAWPAPRDPQEAIDECEYDLAVLWTLLTSRRDQKGGLAYLMKLNDHVARSLRSRWARWNQKWSAYDGLISRHPDEFRKTYSLKSRPYSASALQTFALCPYQFLLSAIYHLEPREEPAPIQQLPPLNRGHMFHTMQTELFRKLEAAKDLPVTAGNLNRALDRLDETVEEIAKRYYDDLAPAIDRIWHDAVADVRADLRGWLLKMASDGYDWEPIHFEFGFGFPATQGSDPKSLRRPVTLPSGHRLHGFVDLIEKSRDQQSLRVTDHKTGAIRTTERLVCAGGEVLQPVLYGLAVEAALGRPVAEGRLYYCTSRARYTEHRVTLNQKARDTGALALTTVDAAISNGSLIPAPKEKACQLCSFRVVCGPYEEIRIAAKADHSRFDELETLRLLP